jgi:hypothetical protein
MILKIDAKTKELKSWMNELPKTMEYTESETGKKLRTHDIRRVLSGKLKTTGGYIWKSVEI